MLLPHFAAVFLGAQVHRAEAVALTAEAGDVQFQRLAVRQVVRVGVDPLQERLRFAFGFVADALGGFGHALFRALGLRLAPRPFLAGGGGGALRFALGGFGGALGVFALRQGLGGGAAPGLGLVDLARQRLPPGSDFVRRGGGGFALCAGFLDAGFKLPDPAGGVVLPGLPPRPFLTGFSDAFFAAFACAAQIVRLSPRGHHRAARRANGDLGPFCGAPRLFRVVHLAARGLGLGPCRLRLLLLFGAAGQRGLQRLAAAPDHIQIRLRLGRRPVRLGGGAVGGAARGAAGLILRRGGLQPRFGFGMGCGAFLRAPFGDSAGGLHFRQTVLLAKTFGGGGGRVFRRGAIAVPAPEVAFPADQTPAGAERRLHRRSLIPSDDSYSGETAGECGGRLHMIRQRLRPRRGCGGVRIVR